MKLFVVKFTYKNGDLSHPWTVFSPNYNAAVARLEHPSDTNEIQEVTVKEVSEKNASFYGRDYNKPDSAALEHTNIGWEKTP